MTKGDVTTLIGFAIFGIITVIIVTTLIIGILLPPFFFTLVIILLVDTLCLLIITMFAEPSLELKKNKNKASQ